MLASFPTPEELRDRFVARILAGIEEGLYSLLTGHRHWITVGVLPPREREIVKETLRRSGWLVGAALVEHEFTISMPAGSP